jgi:hypothetical protein
MATRANSETALLRAQRKLLSNEFGPLFFGQLKHDAITGGRPYSVQRSNGGDYVITLGQRVCSLRVNAGLDNERLLAALSPEKLVHFVPWDCGAFGPTAHIEGRYVVVEAPWPASLQESHIHLRSLARSPHDASRVITGKDQHNTTVTLKYDQIVHALVGGTTGSGKSTALQSVAYQATSANDPQWNRIANVLVLLDGKGGQGLGVCNGLPGQQGPIATTERDWINALGWSYDEMHRRYDAIANRRGQQSRYGVDGDYPRIVIVADEFQVHTENASHPVITELFKMLLVQGRAAGIHIWGGTHKPSVKMFGQTGNASRSMFDATIGLRMPTGTASRVLRGDDACTHLLGRGDARVFAPVDDGQYIDARVQIAYIPEPDMLAASGGTCIMDRWPEFDIESLSDRARNKCGRKSTRFSDQQLALAIYGAQQPRPWGRDALRDELEDAGCPLSGSGTVDRLKEQGKRIASHLMELES